jgi:proliferating cell nuclear antigen
MLLFEINDGKKCDKFNICFKNLKVFTEIINVNVTKEEFHLQGMDSSHICLYEFIFKKEWFDKWGVEKDMFFGLNTESIEKILKTYVPGQSIRLLVDDDNVDKVFFELLKTNNNEKSPEKFLSTFTLNTDQDLMEIPPAEYGVELTYNSKEFKSFIDQLSSFGEVLNFVCLDKKLSMIASSIQDSCKFELNEDDLEEIKKNTKEMNISYSIKYITDVCKFNQLANTITLKLSDEIPLLLQYNIDENIKADFHLAPYVDDDDE